MQETEFRRITVYASRGKQFMRPYLKKTPSHRKGWWSGSRSRPRVQTTVLQKIK
jgi:hypothetical protein